MYAESIPGFADPFNSLSHLIGAAVFLYYGFKLIKFSSGHPGWVTSVSIFVFTVVFLLTMSGVFHLLDHGGQARNIMQRLDHAAIFGLIAGTFTPVHVILFRGLSRWGVLIFVWSLATTGIVLKTIYFNELPEWLGLIFYLGIGWIGVLSAYLTHRLHSFKILGPLIFGALAYSIGAVLEYLRTPVLVPGVIGPHEIFHIAVLVGITCHWYFVSTLITLKRDEQG